MIVRLPRDAAVDIWAVAGDGRRVANSTGGEIDVPTGAVLEVRGRRKARAKLAWLTELGLPVVSVDVTRSEVSAFDLMAAGSLPQLAVFAAASDEIDESVIHSLAQAPHLMVVQLEAHGLSRGGLMPLRVARGLRQVRLDTPNVPAEEILDVLGDKSLVSFGLTMPRMSGALLEQAVSAWPLRELSFTIDTLDGDALHQVSKLSELTTLAIDCSWLRASAMDVTALVNRLPHLDHLDLVVDGAQAPPELLVGAWWLRPGMAINGLTMSLPATQRFVDRWRGSDA